MADSNFYKTHCVAKLLNNIQKRYPGEEVRKTFVPMTFVP